MRPSRWAVPRIAAASSVIVLMAMAGSASVAASPRPHPHPGPAGLLPALRHASLNTGDHGDDTNEALDSAEQYSAVRTAPATSAEWVVSSTWTR